MDAQRGKDRRCIGEIPLEGGEHLTVPGEPGARMGQRLGIPVERNNPRPALQQQAAVASPPQGPIDDGTAGSGAQEIDDLRGQDGLVAEGGAHGKRCWGKGRRA